jgi:hypothetical protein
MAFALIGIGVLLDGSAVANRALPIANSTAPFGPMPTLIVGVERADDREEI